jgi:hypothetical protein
VIQEFSNITVTDGQLTLVLGQNIPAIAAIEVIYHGVPPFTYRINGVGWAADNYWWGGISSPVYYPTPNDILNTTDDALYQVQRGWDFTYTPFTYHFPVPSGNYNVPLHVAELYFGVPGRGSAGAGQHVFDVLMEGIIKLDNFDLTSYAR